MLVARSSPECRLYMELHPCDCGTSSFEQRHWLEERGDDLLAIYEGPCVACRKPRRFELALVDDMPPAPPAYGGSDPSQIIDPGEFLLAAERVAGQVPEDADGLAPHLRTAARKDLACAIAALDEVLKFIPDGDDRVPPSCFRSPAGRQAFAAEPARFDRRRIETMIEAYRGRLTALNGAPRRSSMP